MELYDNIACESAPVADSHLANKAYVDAAVANGAGTASGPEGDTVSIPAHSLISCGLAPTDDSHLVNKAYVDAAVAAAGSATPIEEPAALGRVVYVDTLSDAASHTGTSLRDAIEAVTSNTSVVIKFSVSGTITLEQGEIVIPVGNIAIDGEDKITISGGGVSRVFSMTNAYAVLSLHRLVITGGNGVGAADSQVYGGAVYTNAEQVVLNAHNVTFSGNEMVGLGRGSGTAFGGAVGCCSGRMHFVECTFRENSLSNPGAVAHGGALCIVGHAVFDCCLFDGNTVTGSVTNRGGAVNVSGFALFRDCVFENNYAAEYGGALLSESYSVLSRCTFRGNGTDITNFGYGGAVYLRYNQCIVVDCTFTDNTALRGGDIYVAGASASQYWLSVRRCKFDGGNGVSNGRGTAICFNYGSGTIEDCEFTNHAGDKAYGVIYTYGYTNKPFQVTINRCKFIGNSTTTTTNGLIYCANNADVHIYNSVFTGNSAATAGVNVACLYTTGTSTLTAGNLTITNNEKLRSFRAASGTITIYNSVDVGNVAVPTMTNVTAISPLTNWSYGAGRIAYDSSKPLFAADGYTPVAGSQVIDAGDDDYVETVYDLAGKARVSGTSVDVGAVEWQSS